MVGAQKEMIDLLISSQRDPICVARLEFVGELTLFAWGIPWGRSQNRAKLVFLRLIGRYPGSE